MSLISYGGRGKQLIHGMLSADFEVVTRSGTGYGVCTHLPPCLSPDVRFGETDRADISYQPLARKIERRRSKPVWATAMSRTKGTQSRALLTRSCIDPCLRESQLHVLILPIIIHCALSSKRSCPVGFGISRARTESSASKINQNHRAMPPNPTHLALFSQFVCRSHLANLLVFCTQA